MKISKLLPITLALSLCMSTATFAAMEETKQLNQADYKLYLTEYLDIEATAPTEVGAVDYNSNYSSISLQAPVTGSFQVISNTNTKDVYLYATCLAGSEVPALYGTDVNELKLVFTNIAVAAPESEEGAPVEGAKTTSDSVVSGIRNGTITEASGSPNAIVFDLKVTPTLDANKSLAGGSITAGTISDNTNVKYTMPNGVATFACSVSGTDAVHFSPLDTNGTYRATLYMSDTPYVANP